MKRAALFIGINDYKDPEIRNLTCARNDARSLYKVFLNWDVY